MAATARATTRTGRATPPHSGLAGGLRATTLAAVTLLAVAFGVGCTPSPDEVDDEQPLVIGDGAPELLDELATIAEQVAELRGLEVLEPIHLDVVSEQELIEIHRELRAEDAEDEERTERRDRRQRALEALHLLPEGVDIDAAFEELVEVGVLGMFSPRTERAYAVAIDGELSPAVTATVAHELLHALQHQHAGLERMDDIDEPDERFALTTLVEGDAVTLEEAWVDEHLDEDEQQERDRTLARLGTDAQSTLVGIPVYLLLKQLLPYQIGEPFVARLLEEGGQEAVDAALEDPPRTSVEVIDPQLYLDGFEPREPEPLLAPGEGWEEFHATTFGAWQVDVFSYTLGPGRSPIGGQWRGGHLRAWSDGQDGVAAAFSVTFDGDAAETFCDRLGAWYERRAGAEAADDGTLRTDRDVVRLDCGAEDVRLAVAADRSLADAILGDA